VDARRYDGALERDHFCDAIIDPCTKKMSKKDNSGFIQHLVSGGKKKLQKIIPFDEALFLFQFFKHPFAIGAITPSSKALAESMTRYVLSDGAERRRYLEVGAGTGAFTKTLISKLCAQDMLDVVEINPLFCERLKKKYHNNPNVSVHHVSIMEWMPDYRYDAIISSLPFNVFNAHFVEDILNQYLYLCKGNGMISFFEYMALAEIKKFFSSDSARKNLMQTLKVTSVFEHEYEIQVEKVFINLPPAIVHHCRL
jgi:phosphatidylethanolamine/phosphatidyl-N-methylethanolamine N-methyltransferase